MKTINSYLDDLRTHVRSRIKTCAVILNHLSGGRISANQITLIGVTAHIPIAGLIVAHYYIFAAVLLIFFGLFDTLDGELARLQHKASSTGMLLDASTDRFKEVILYVGIAYSLVIAGHPKASIWATAALGSSLCVSYVKAKGETALGNSSFSVSQKNRFFQDGLLRFEVRMALIVIGLLIHQLMWILIIITVLAVYTALERLIKITRKLNAQD
ncbi:MAG: archaetidylinositol phosphate synthase [Candidatus Saccharimonadales bacterium]